MTRYRSRALVTSIVLVLVAGSPALAQAATLSLADALAALPNAPGWQRAELDYRSAEDALAAARAAAGLQVSAGGSYGRSDTLAGPTARGGPSASVSVSASVTVLPWAPSEAGIANAELALKVAVLNRDAARAAMVVTVEQQYFAARLAATAGDVARQGLDVAQARLAAAEAQHAQGQTNDDGLAQAKAAAANARAALAQVQATLELARLALFDTLGLPASDAALTTAPSAGTAPAGTVDQWLRTALPRRDDVRVAQIRVSQAEQALAASQAERWIPSASLSLGVAGSDGTGTPAGIGVNASLDVQKGVVSGSASYPLAPAPAGAVSTQLRIGASVSIPLDAPSSDASIASARTALQSAQAALSATERAAELDIRQRYAGWLGAQATITADRASAAAASQALVTARARLAAGLATKLDVGSAEVAQAQAQRTVESDQNALTVVLLQLRNALGESIASPGGKP